MAPALKACLPLWVSFCGPWFLLSCQSNGRGERSRVLSVSPDPGSTVCFESPRKEGTEENRQLGKPKHSGGRCGGGVGVQLFDTLWGKGQGKKLKLEDFRERKRKKPFLTLPFNLLIFSGVRVFTKFKSKGQQIHACVSMQDYFLFLSHGILKCTFQYYFWNSRKFGNQNIKSLIMRL